MQRAQRVQQMAPRDVELCVVTFQGGQRAAGLHHLGEHIVCGPPGAQSRPTACPRHQRGYGKQQDAALPSPETITKYEFGL